MQAVTTLVLIASIIAHGFLFQITWNSYRHVQRLESELPVCREEPIKNTIRRLQNEKWIEENAPLITDEELLEITK